MKKTWNNIILSVFIPAVILGLAQGIENRTNDSEGIPLSSIQQEIQQNSEEQVPKQIRKEETVTEHVYEISGEVLPLLDGIDQKALEKIAYQVVHQDRQVNEFRRKDKVIMGKAEYYADVRGVTCFRGNHYRNRASYGYINVKEKKLRKIWEVPIGGIDRWTGVGWNGQPAIIQWPEEIRRQMNIKEEKKNKEGLQEVIYAALDGKVYFLDLEDGSFTRDPIQIPGPVKGSVTVDPRGIPLLYVGQGIDTVHGKKVETGYRIFELIRQKKLFFINGRDPFAYRSWPAFDSTAIVDKHSDTLFIAGENGILYTVKLNTKYDKKKPIINIQPDVTKYRYKIQGNPYQGIENSAAIYRNFVYFADNGGWLQCVDINTMKPVWTRNVHDDTDSTIVLEEEKDHQVMLYTASEVDKQGKKGYSYIRKIDGLSGEIVWEKAYPCDSQLGEHPNNGGALATPVIGKQSIDQMVIYNLARCGGFNKGLLVALNKNTGEEIWKVNLEYYSWSSPVDVYTRDGEAFLLLGDSAGNLFLIEGLTGKILDQVKLGANIEGSPAVFENRAVVGTRGQRIYGIEIY